MKKIIPFCIFILVAFLVCEAQNPWPAENWSEATNLTSLSKRFSNDLSGAHWNPVKRELWLVMNGSGTVAKLVEDEEEGFKLDATWRPDGDLEGITQADYLDSTVFVIEEKKGKIKEIDISTPDKPHIIHSWKISPDIPKYNGTDGPEGIVFIPNEWLIRSGFKDHAGSYAISQNGMDGFFFVAHQKSGYIYVFDLNRSGDTYNYIGKYASSRDESAGLEFDRSTGCLYILHNEKSNYIEVTDLSSSPFGKNRKFISIKEFSAPTKKNIEGLALTPEESNDNWCWLTVDDGHKDALRWFHMFRPNPYGANGCVTINTTSVNKNTWVKSLNIFPNPTFGNLTIIFNNTYTSISVQVINNYGQQIIKENFSSSDTVNLEIKEKPGIYFVKISADENFGILKVFKTSN